MEAAQQAEAGKLCPGDVVITQVRQKDGDAKHRPALVVAAPGSTDGRAVVRLAYGTSQRTAFASETELLVSRTVHGTAFLATGLMKDTKFVLRDFVNVPQHACRRIGKIPKSLSGDLLDAARAAYKAGFL